MLSSFHLNGHNLGFHSQTEKLIHLDNMITVPQESTDK